MKEPSVVFFLITLMLAVAHGNDEPVKDSAGHPVVTGEQYFIQPVKTEKSNKGGGLVPTAIRFTICPLGITQTLLPNQPGLPVAFSLPKKGDAGTTVTKKGDAGTTVTTSLGVNIEFKSDFWPFCDGFSKFWEVDDDSPSAQKERAILIGGKSGDQNSKFEIEKAGDGENTYKLTATSYGTVRAKPAWFWGGAPQLIITNDVEDKDKNTLLVKFKKVDDATTATTPTSRVDKLGLRMFPFY